MSNTWDIVRVSKVLLKKEKRRRRYPVREEKK
jgi:hypothetical protein